MFVVSMVLCIYFRAKGKETKEAWWVRTVFKFPNNRAYSSSTSCSSGDSDSCASSLPPMPPPAPAPAPAPPPSRSSPSGISEDILICECVDSMCICLWSVIRFNQVIRSSIGFLGSTCRYSLVRLVDRVIGSFLSFFLFLIPFRDKRLPRPPDLAEATSFPGLAAGYPEYDCSGNRFVRVVERENGMRKEKRGKRETKDCN